ncbi:MAG: hypothetical protein WKF77_07770 [Planctomycetaceae bacterium]
MHRILALQVGQHGMLHLIAITDGTGRILVSRALPSPALAEHATNYLDSGCGA